MRRMYDAAFPPAIPPKWEAVAGYIGGGTPHVWTDTEWREQTEKSGAQFRLPIFVRVPPTVHNPQDDAAHAIDWLSRHNVPKGVCVCLDYETAVNATYLRLFDAAIIAAGYKTILYGSLSTVLRNPKPSGGYWTAHWTGTPHLCTDSTGNSVAATQWSGSGPFGGKYDASVVKDTTPLWEVDSMPTIQEIEAAAERAVDHVMSLGLTGSRDGAIKAWADSVLKKSDVDAIATAVANKFPPGTTPDLAMIKQAVREVLIEGTGGTP